MDATTGTVLFEKGADDLSAPASTAKIMTAEIVFQELRAGRLKLDDTMNVSENAWRKGGANAGGSTMFAQLNSRVRVEDLIRGLLIQSGNDAAITLAEGIAGTEESFAVLMNKRAREIGMVKSTFRNARGKADPGQKVTPREMAILASHVIRTYPDYYRYFGEKEFTWSKIRQLNRNPLLFMDIGADGLKTGNIDESGYTLVGSAVEGSQRLILVVMGAKSAKERADESRKILQWGFRSFESKTVFLQGEIIGTAQVYGGTQNSVGLITDGPVQLLIPRASTERLTGRIVYSGPLVAPIETGAEIARLKIMRGSTQTLDIPLKSAEKVGVGNLPSRAFDAAWEMATGFIRSRFAKK